MRRVHSVEYAPARDRAVVFLSLNRSTIVLPVRATEAGSPEFGAAILVPWGTEARFSPGGEVLLLTSTEDLHLPAGSGFLLNRGALCLAFDAGPWCPEVSTALDRRSDVWYRAPDLRFVPRDDFELLDCRLGVRGGRLEILAAGSGRTVVPLSPVSLR